MLRKSIYLNRMGYNLNTKALKARLTIEDHKKIMKALDIPAYTETSSVITYWTGDKNRDAMKGSPGKLVFYKDTKVYMGYTAATSYDIIALVQKRLKLLSKPCAFFDAINFIIETTSLEIDTVKRINAPHVCDWSGLEKFIRFRSTGSTLEPYDKSILNQLNHSIPQQWLDEGISLETMVKYQIGYYERSQATTIPCFAQDGSLIGIRCRHWRPEEIEQGKYRPLSLLNGRTYKFPTNNVFYNINWVWPEIERTGSVILVEGEKSCMKADTWYGDKSIVLGLYGSNIGNLRRNQLIKMNVHEVNLAIDSDFHCIGDKEYIAFEVKVNKLAKLFQGYANVNVIYNNIGLDGYKCSPFDFDKKTFEELYKKREYIY